MLRITDAGIRTAGLLPHFLTLAFTIVFHVETLYLQYAILRLLKSLCNTLCEVLLSLQGIRKSFGGVQALSNGNLDVSEGEVHLLMGENGAGKSTLMKIVAGMYRRDGGEMLWRGQPVSFERPAEAAANGVAMVHQESLLAPHLNIAENIFLGHESDSRIGWVRRGSIVEKASAVISGLGFQLDPETSVARLSPAGKQLVEICRAVAQGSSLLIFDEPTSSLSETETKEVFRIVRELCRRGIGIIYITHRLEELRSIGDRVTVLRDGATVHTGALADLSRDQLIQYMVGRPVNATYHRESLPPGEPLLRVKGISRGFVRDISFVLRAGEIVGLGGLMGAGRTELCRVLFGLDPAEAGTVEVAGRSVNPRNPRQAIARGVALIPEDRQHNGLALKLPIAHNITLPDLGRVSRLGILNKTSETTLAADYRERLHIRCSSPYQLAGRLSGGNQQKIVIAKWVARGARVFLFDEPTRGIDVAAKQEVFEEMDRLARGGAAILMVSSELPELLQVADRVLVMREGRLSGELSRPTTQEEIMRLAAPIHSAAETVQ
jgi:ribose transport system ATP-binding protein